MPFAVQTAWNYRSVAKHRDLAAEPVAELCVGTAVGGIARPVEFVRVFHKEVGEQPAAALSVRGQGGHVPAGKLTDEGFDFPVPDVAAAAIPQAQDAGHAALGERHGTFHTAADIVRQRQGGAVRLVCVEGDVQPVETRGGAENR